MIVGFSGASRYDFMLNPTDLLRVAQNRSVSWDACEYFVL